MRINLAHKVVAAVTILAVVAFTGRAAQADCSAAYGQHLIDTGQYQQAIDVFTCVIAAHPTEPEGYRGRIEARLLLGQYSEAMRDFTLITARVTPETPNAVSDIIAGYNARLKTSPQSIPALTGKSFFQWSDFDYPGAIKTLGKLLEIQPDGVFGNLFRGSSRVLKGISTSKGVADLDRAIQLDPTSPDVRFIVADAYTYGLPDPQRAFDEASFALTGGLNTPRVHAILAAAYLAFGDMPSAAVHIKTHIDLVTSEFVLTNPADPDTTDTLELVPGRTFSIPIPAAAGELISIQTSSADYWDTILVLLAPDGTPVAAADDDWFYFAELDWVAEETGTYLLQVTFFESVNYGEVVVTRN